MMFSLTSTGKGLIVRRHGIPSASDFCFHKDHPGKMGDLNIVGRVKANHNCSFRFDRPILVGDGRGRLKTSNVNEVLFDLDYFVGGSQTIKYISAVNGGHLAFCRLAEPITTNSKRVRVRAGQIVVSALGINCGFLEYLLRVFGGGNTITTFISKVRAITGGNYLEYTPLPETETEVTFLDTDPYPLIGLVSGKNIEIVANGLDIGGLEIIYGKMHSGEYASMLYFFESTISRSITIPRLSLVVHI